MSTDPLNISLELVPGEPLGAIVGDDGLTTWDRRIAILEAEVAKCRRVLTKSLANFNRKHRAHRQALTELLAVNVRLRTDLDKLSK